MPFTKLVRSNDKIVIGHAKSDREIESSWKWRQVNKEQAGQPSSTPKATPAQPPASLPKQPSLSAVGGSLADKIVQTSVLKGVTLKQVRRRKKFFSNKYLFLFSRASPSGKRRKTPR